MQGRREIFTTRAQVMWVSFILNPLPCIGMGNPQNYVHEVDQEIKQLIICVRNTQNDIFRPKSSGVVISQESKNGASLLPLRWQSLLGQLYLTVSLQF